MSHVINGTPGATAVARKPVKAHHVEAAQMLVCEAVQWDTSNPKATKVAIAVYASGAEPVAEEYAEHLKIEGHITDFNAAICDEYKWAVVGQPERKRGWILSRTPQIEVRRPRARSPFAGPTAFRPRCPRAGAGD